MKKFLTTLCVILGVSVLVFAFDFTYNDKKIYNALFNAETEDEIDDTITINHKHNVDDVFTYNENQHFYKCNGCDERFEVADHTFEWVVDVEPTYTTYGKKHEECVCGAKRNIDTSIDYAKLEANSALDFSSYEQTATSEFNGAPAIKVDNAKTTGNDLTYSQLADRYTSDEENYKDVAYSIRWNATTDKVNFLTVGTVFRCGGDTRIYLRAVPSSSVPYSIDFVVGSYRYRYISSDIEALYNDFLQCGYIDFDIGCKEFNGNKYYAFRFATENVEFNYEPNSDTASINNDTKFFLASSSTSTSGEEITFGAIERFYNSSIGFSIGNSLSVITYVSYVENNDCTYVTAQNSSTWFNEYLNNNAVHGVLNI